MPPLPRQIQTFGGGAPVHEGLSPIDLAELFSSADSVNVYVDKGGPLGQVRKVPGFTKQNSTAITTDTGGSAVKVVGVHPYASISGGSTTRHVLATVDDETNEFELHRSTDDASTFSFLKQLGTTVGLLPDWAQMANNGYLADGNGAPQVYDGTSAADVGGTQSPAPSASVGSDGNLRGVYEYKLLSLKVDKDRQLASGVSAELRVEDSTVSVTWSADADTEVVGYELYRTTGSGLEFRLVDYIDGRLTTAYTDNKSDAELLRGRPLEEHGDPPPDGIKYVEPHKQRMWWFNDPDNPRRGYWSDPGLADSVGEDNFLEFTDAESATDQITGGTGNFHDVIIVWQEFSVWAVSGTGEVVDNIPFWTRWKTTAQVGTVTARSVARIPAGAKFLGPDGQMQSTSQETLAYFTPHGTINLLSLVAGDFASTVISWPKQDFLDTFQYAQRRRVVVEHDEVEGHVRWYFSASGQGHNDNSVGVMWDYVNGTWTELTGRTHAAAATIQTSTSAQVLLVGESRVSNGGFVYESWTGTSLGDAGNDIAADFWTKPFFGRGESGEPLTQQRKIWDWLELVTEDVASTQNITVRWYEGIATSGATARGTKAVDMNETGFTHGSNRIDLEDSSGNFMHSKAIRLRVGDDADDESFAVATMALQYGVIPGLPER